MKVRSFADPAVVATSDDELANIIANGKGKMPKYSSLKPEQIKGLVEYCRSLIIHQAFSTRAPKGLDGTY
jgi:hypothetical protein